MGRDRTWIEKETEQGRDTRYHTRLSHTRKKEPNQKKCTEKTEKRAMHPMQTHQNRGCSSRGLQRRPWYWGGRDGCRNYGRRGFWHWRRRHDREGGRRASRGRTRNGSGGACCWDVRRGVRRRRRAERRGANRRRHGGGNTASRCLGVCQPPGKNEK